MHYLFGGDKKQDPKITNEFSEQIKGSLKGQFCQFCNKNLSTKVAFVPDIKRGFTCNNCELEAVGKQFKNLSQKTLLPNDKISQTITKALINYQTIQAQSPQQVKEIQNDIKIHLKQTHEAVDKIKNQIKLLKSTCDNKLNQLIKESQQQNSIFLFQQLNKKCKDKKANLEQIISLVTKRSMVNSKGLHFIDEVSIQKTNSSIDQKLSNLKNQTKIRLKQVDQLAQWIGKIQL